MFVLLCSENNGKEEVCMFNPDIFLNSFNFELDKSSNVEFLDT